MTQYLLSGLRRFGLLSVGFIAGIYAASASDLVIRLEDDPSISRRTVEYQCNVDGAKIGMPSGPFNVEYINAGSNRLVIVPISGNQLIFSNVISGSGARYTAQQYTWWEAKGTVALSSDSLTGKLQSSCREVNRKSGNSSH